MAKKSTKTKEVAVVDDNSPSFAMEVSADDMRDIIDASLAGEQVSRFDFEQIKVPGSGGIAWTIPEFGGERVAKELDAVIIHSYVNRAYWEGEYGDGEAGPPDCRSENAITGIGSPGGECRTCPQAEFGSAAKGAGQACTMRRVMFLLPPNEENKFAMIPTVLAVPPTSLKAAKQYMLGMVGQGLKPHQVLTRMTLKAEKNPNGQPYSVIEFTPVKDGLSEATKAMLADYVNSIQPHLVAAARDLADQEYGTGAADDHKYEAAA